MPAKESLTTLPQESQACRVCSSTQLRREFEYEHYHFARCVKCGHVFVTESIPSALLEASYGQDYYIDDLGDASRTGYADYPATFERRLKGCTRRFLRLEQIVGFKGRCIDFGCAIGVTVKAAQDCGWEAYGYERSEWAAAYGREHLRVNIVTGDGEADPFEPGSFDLVTMWDVLEHVEHPRRVIALAAKWLRPGGWLAINTVNGGSLAARFSGRSWRHWAPPHHLQYFTRSSLAALLSRNGFTIRNMRGNGVFLEARRGAVADNRGWKAIEALVTHWRFRPIADALDLLDEVEVLARRR